MEDPTGFDLKAAVAAWRRSLLAGGQIWPGEADELEAHLLDHIADLTDAGVDRAVAFRRAVEEMGQGEELAVEMSLGRRRRDMRGRGWEALDLIGNGLLTNYVRVIRRTLMRNRGFATISILGLSIGITACLLLVAFVRYERSYDRFHTRGNSIYRVAKGPRANTPGLWGPELEKTFPQIEQAVRVMDGAFGRARFRLAEESSPTGPGIVADSGFFGLFDWPILAGSPDDLLVRPYTVVLSRPLSVRLFGERDPIGQSLTVMGTDNMPDAVDLEVTGIFEPENRPSHLAFGFVLSMETIEALEAADRFGTPFSWTNAFVKTYVRLRPDVSPEEVESLFPAFIDARVGDSRYTREDVFLQPLTDIHLRSSLRGDAPDGGGIRLVQLLLGLSLFVLAIAVANFVNLSVARCMQRHREVGMRRALGADRRHLMVQFLGESVAIATIATACSVPLVYLARPGFETLIGRPLPLSAMLDGSMVAIQAGTALLVGTISGLYPAWTLARMHPATVLRSRPLSMARGSSGRILVVGQFVIAIALTIATVVFQRQLGFVLNADLGYSPQSVIVVPAGQSETVSDRADDVARRLESDPSVEFAATSHSVPSAFLNGFSYRREGADVEERVSLGSVSVGRRFFEAFGMRVVAGRWFEEGSAADSNAFVVNSEAARRLGFDDPRSATGVPIQWDLDPFTFAGPIVGVVDDMHFGSLKEAMPPIVFHLSRFGSNYIVVRPRAGRIPEAVAAARSVWQAVEGQHPFAYEMLTARIAGQYEADRRLSRLFEIAASVAIALACLGLLGLTAFMVERRRRELSVRKVLGATTVSILVLFVREFSRWIAVALIIAAPLAWIGVDRWLSTFAYRVDIGPAPFVVGGVVALTAATVAIVIQAVPSAVARPAAALRSE